MSEENLPARTEEIEIPRPQSREPEHVHAEKSLKLQAIRAQSFSGPLPPPELLGKYEDLCPGSADRIIALAERESEHRRSIEQALLHSEVEQNVRDSHEARRGQVCAVLITLAAIVAGAYTALNGHEVAGSIIGVGGIGSIVTSFLAGKASQDRNQEPGGQQSQPKAGTVKSAKAKTKKKR